MAGNTDIVKDIVEAFCRNDADRAVIDAHFAPDFEYWGNGRKSDLRAYAGHLATYVTDYDSFSIPAWDELFAAEDKVVTADILEAKKKDGTVQTIPVMAVWRLAGGKVVSLREVSGTV